jgi:hypothetical protein
LTTNEGGIRRLDQRGRSEGDHLELTSGGNGKSEVSYLSVPTATAETLLDSSDILLQSAIVLQHVMGADGTLLPCGCLRRGSLKTMSLQWISRREELAGVVSEVLASAGSAQKQVRDKAFGAR